MKKLLFFIIIIMVLILLFFSKLRPLANKNNFVNLSNMKIYSTDFGNNEFIPKDFTCDGLNINPEIIIENIPNKSKSLVLIVDDPDAPGGVWTHWTVWNISPKISIIKRGELPEKAIEGKTDFGTIGWGGPCPPPGNSHRYFFKVFALDIEINLERGASRKKLELAIFDHILDKAEFFGLYKR